jgi:hypothetical protein
LLSVGAACATFVGLLLDGIGLAEDPEPFAELGKLGGGGSRLGRFGM